VRLLPTASKGSVRGVPSDKRIFTDCRDYPCTTDEHRLYYTYENTIHRHNDGQYAMACGLSVCLSMLRGLTMTTLERLRKSALESCKFREHKMTRFASLHNWAKVADCKVCGMSVYVNSKPAPNGIDISGEAVALTCTG
jgi:hypothetical protein